MSSLSHATSGALEATGSASRAVSADGTASEQHKAILNRFARIIGHIQKVKVMTEEHKDLEQILVQLSAVKSALSGLSRALAMELISERLCGHDSSVQASDVRFAVELIERYVK